MDLCHALIVMVTKKNLHGERATAYQNRTRVRDRSVTHLGSGLGISNELFNCVPLMTVLAELEEEAGYKGAKEPSALGEHT